MPLELSSQIVQNHVVKRLFGLSVVALIGAPVWAQRLDTSAKAVAAAATAYVDQYQQQLAFLLADEQYTQQVFDGQGRETARRTMTGESFVTFVPADRAWISVHDVAEIDGKPVENREDLPRLLQRLPVAGAARLLTARNAAFNIGHITRTFNEPTLGLLVVEARRRPQFRFTRTGETREGEATIVTLAFKEVDEPTLVRGEDGRQVHATGSLDVDAGTGRIQHTSMRLALGTIIAQVTTRYARDPKLDIWVPTVFGERYEQTRSDRREVIVCEATYTNYRKFQVNVRIK